MSSTTSQGIRYLVVGGFNVGFTLVVFWILDRLYSAAIGVQPVYWISAVLGIANGFIWQRLLVWRSRNRWHTEFLRFLTVNIITSLSNSLLLYLAVGLAKFAAFPSQVVITGLLVVMSFFLARSWVFRGSGIRAKQTEAQFGMPNPTPRRIDVFLQYYKPHVSGLTNVAADLAEYAAANGFDVHVHCVSLSNRAEVLVMNGVTVHAYLRSFSIGRGVFSLPLIRQIWRMRKRAGIAHAHLPYPESFLLSWILGAEWKLIATFQCDAPMTGGVDNLIARALDWSEKTLIRRAVFTVSSSDDYARHSRLARVMAEHGGRAIPATSVDRCGGKPVFAKTGKRYVGFLGRPTSEKGISVALDALDRLPDDVCLLLAGPVVGLSEKASFDRHTFTRLSDAGRIRSLGFLEEDQIADYYASLEVFILPSTNSFEAFGIVQVEAISAGTPVVASNLPGVRTIVQTTGFGEIAEVGDAQDLARCILKAIGASYDGEAARAALEHTYLSPIPEMAYLALYERMLS